LPKLAAKSKAATASATKFHIDKRAPSILAGSEGHDDALLSTPEMAVWLGVSVPWLEIGRAKGYGPPFKRLSARSVRYRIGDAKAWLETRTFSATSEYPKKKVAST
jgi:predicted DNA-binding transcriptional regulator AlpA